MDALPWHLLGTTVESRNSSFIKSLVISSVRKVAVISGESKRICAGLVRGFPKHGYRLVTNSRSIKLDASADVITIAGEIADPAVAERMIGGAVEKFGRGDALLNNAGMFTAKPLTEFTGADFAAKISLNLARFYHVSQRAIRQMLAQDARAGRL